VSSPWHGDLPVRVNLTVSRSTAPDVLDMRWSDVPAEAVRCRTILTPRCVSLTVLWQGVADPE
jgi:hypothetical protein